MFVKICSRNFRKETCKWTVWRQPTVMARKKSVLFGSMSLSQAKSPEKKKSKEKTHVWWSNVTCLVGKLGKLAMVVAEKSNVYTMNKATIFHHFWLLKIHILLLEKHNFCRSNQFHCTSIWKRNTYSNQYMYLRFLKTQCNHPLWECRSLISQKLYDLPSGYLT